MGPAALGMELEGTDAAGVSRPHDSHWVCRAAEITDVIVWACW